MLFRKRKVFLFSSYGWSNDAIQQMRAAVEEAGGEIIGERCYKLNYCDDEFRELLELSKNLFV